MRPSCGVLAVSGPVEYKPGCWKVDFSTVGGRNYSSRKLTKSGAKKFYTQKKKLLVPPPPPIPENIITRPYDGTLSWWSKLLGDCAYRLVVTSDANLRQDIRAIAQAAMSAKNLYDTAQIERDFAELKNFVEEKMSEQDTESVAWISGPDQGPETSTH